MKMNFLKKVVRSITGRENVLRESLSVIYTGERLEPAVREYRIRLLKSYAAVGAATLVLVAASVLSSYGNGGSLSEIVRPEAGSAGRTVPVKVQAEYGGQKIESTENLNISAALLSESRKKKILSSFAESLPDMVAGKDGNGRHIAEGDLDLPEKDSDTGIEISWKSSDPEVLSEKGKVDITALEGKGETVMLTAVLMLGGVTREKSFGVFVGSNPGVCGATLKNQIQASVDRISDTKKGTSVVLPGKTPGGIELSWSEHTGSYAAGTAALGILLLFCLHAGRYDRARKNAKKYRESVAADFPFVVDKLVLLLNSGLTVFSALMRISSDYSDEKRYRKSPAAGEIAEIGRRVQETNASVTEEWKEFAIRMESGDILRFCTILEDNMSKGSELSHKLEHESDELRELRKKNIQQYIRMIDSKMMIPMIAMLFSLVLVTIAPIITGF